MVLCCCQTQSEKFPSVGADLRLMAPHRADSIWSANWRRVGGNASSAKYIWEVQIANNWNGYRQTGSLLIVPQPYCQRSVLPDRTTRLGQNRIVTTTDYRHRRHHASRAWSVCACCCCIFFNRFLSDRLSGVCGWVSTPSRPPTRNRRPRTGLIFYRPLS